MRGFLLVVALLSGCSSSTQQAQPTPAATPEPPPAPPPAPPVVDVPPPRIALVLGGGGARGFAHVGVLRALEQARIPVSLIVGTSVGSLIGALYASKPNTFELEWKAFEIEKDDLFDYSLLSAATGPVRGDAIQEFVRTHVKPDKIEEFPINFVAVATDLHTGERVDFVSGSVVEAVRASVSIPGVFTPARIGGRTLIDGGVIANLAVGVAREHGADIVIASDISSAVAGTAPQNLVDIALQSINIMMARMAEAEAAAADVRIAPPIGDVGTLDFSQKKRCMDAGIGATQAKLDAIRGAINKYYEDRGGVAPVELVGAPPW